MANNYNMFGIRFDDRDFEIGEEIPKSNRWEDGNCTDEQLDGTCTLYVSDESDFLDYLDGKKEVDDELKLFEWALSKASTYKAKHVYIAAINSSWGYSFGEDENEVIMNGAEVVRKIK